MTLNKKYSLEKIIKFKGQCSINNTPLFCKLCFYRRSVPNYRCGIHYILSNGDNKRVFATEDYINFCKKELLKFKKMKRLKECINEIN